MFIQAESEGSDSEPPNPTPAPGGNSRPSGSNAPDNPKPDEKDSKTIRDELIERIVQREADNAPMWYNQWTIRHYLQDRLSVASGDREYLDWKLILTDEEKAIIRQEPIEPVEQELKHETKDLSLDELEIDPISSSQLEAERSELRTRIARRVIAQMPEHISEQDVVNYLENPRTVNDELRALMEDQLIISPAERTIVQPVTEQSADESQYDTANSEMNEPHLMPSGNETQVDRFQLLNQIVDRTLDQDLDGTFEDEGLLRQYLLTPNALTTHARNYMAWHLPIAELEWEQLNPTIANPARTVRNPYAQGSEDDPYPLEDRPPTTLWEIYLECDEAPDRNAAVDQFIQRYQLTRLLNAEDISSLRYTWMDLIPPERAHLEPVQRAVYDLFMSVPVNLQEPEITENYIREVWNDRHGDHHWIPPVEPRPKNLRAVYAKILSSGEPNLQDRINAFVIKYALSAILTGEEVQSLSYQ